MRDAARRRPGTGEVPSAGRSRKRARLNPATREQDVGTAPALDEPGVGGDDEHDAERPQHHAGLQVHPPPPTGGGGRLRLELGDGGDVPAGRQVAEPVLEPDRRLDVGQRVATEADEGVVGSDLGTTEHLGVERGDARAGGVPVAGAAGGRQDPAAVRLAVRQVGQLGDLRDADAPDGQAGQRGHGGAHRSLGGGGHDAEPLVVAGAQRTVAERRQVRLHPVEVDAQAEGLGDPAQPPRHLPQPLRRAAGEVAGAELADGGAEGEVVGPLGVAEHDVGARVDELPDAVLDALDRRQVEGAAGDGDADGRRVVEGELGREAGHPRRRLGLAVHDVEADVAAAAPGRPPSDGVGRQAPPGAGQRAERREVEVLRVEAVEELEGAGDAGDRGDADGTCVVPERRLDDRALGEEERGARRQVAVDHGEAVGVVPGERRGRHVVDVDAERLDDGSGVGGDVRRREPDELGGTGRAGGRQQDGEVGVEVVAAAHPPLVEVCAGDHHVGVVAGQQVPVVARRIEQEHDVAGSQRAEVPDQRVEGRLGGQRDEATGGAEPPAGPLDEVLELVVAQRPRVDVHRGAPAPPGEVDGEGDGGGGGRAGPTSTSATPPW